MELFIADEGKLNTDYRKESSYNGYSIDVLKSALQKYIRRADSVYAIYSAIELDLFAYCKNGEKIRTNMLNRLRIIYLEDCCTDVGLWVWMNDMINKLDELRESRKSESDFESEEWRKIRLEEQKILPQIVHELARTKHSRENSFYRTTYNNTESSILTQNFPWFKKIVEEINNDQILITGQSDIKIQEYKIYDEQKRDVCALFVQNLKDRNDRCVYYAHLISKYENNNINHYRSKKSEFIIFHLIGQTIPYLYEDPKYIENILKISINWCKILTNLKEKFLCWQNLLLIILKNRDFNTYNPDIRNANKLVKLYKINIRKSVKCLHPFVFDMHTKIGKRLKKDNAEFAREGSVVVNEDESINDKYRELYMYTKLYNSTQSTQPVKESEYFDFIVRAQLICTSIKNDTYFAKKDGKLVFVKGPFQDNILDKFMEIQTIKKKLGFPIINYSKVRLIPDLFPDIPLGFRKGIDRCIAMDFMYCESLFDVDVIPVCIHSSKLWPPTEIVDWKKLGGNVDHFGEFVDRVFVENSTDKLLEQFCDILIFRYIYGIGDLAKRNFLVKNNVLYSIDEDSIGKTFSIYNNLKQKKYDIVMNYIRTNKDKYIGAVSKYVNLTDAENTRKKKLTDLIDGKISTL